MRSPLLNVNRACQTCHKWSEEELKDRVLQIQHRNFKLRNMAMDALMQLIADVKAARAAGATDAELQGAREAQRRAQFYIDFVEAENSTGFHAPQEAARIFGEAIDHLRRGQIALRDARKTRAAAGTAAVAATPPPSAATPGSRLATPVAGPPGAETRTLRR